MLYKVSLLILGFLIVFPFNLFAVEWKKFDTIAKQQIGTPYKFGGDTPQKGFDCSGLVEYIYSRVGKQLPHGTKPLISMGKKIDIKSIQPGDLIFFKPGRSVSHVGIYLGDGVLVHAPSTGKNVTVMDVFNHIYWSKKIAYAVRIVPKNFFQKTSI